MKEFHAAVLIKINKPLSIKKIKSNPLKRGQVLVKILYSGVCRSQLMEIEGKRGDDIWLPHLLGHEGSGIIEEIGQDVKKFKKGDEVILTWLKGDGIEAEPAKYNCTEDNSIINAGKVTTLSNYSVVSENRLVKKPEVLSFDQAVLFGCALPTGAGMVINEIPLDKNIPVVVLGLGGIGLSAIAMLISREYKNIVAIDISKDKLDLVKSWGKVNVLNANDPKMPKKMNKIFPNGAKFCIESAGKVSSIELGFSLINKAEGNLIFASHPPEGEKIKLSPHELISGKSIKGSWGGSTKLERDLPVICNDLLRKDFPLKDLLSKPYSLNQINNSFNDLKSGKVLRPLIKMEHL